MRARVVFITTILATVACSRSPHDLAVSQAEDAVKARLKDTDSAEFSNETVMESSKYGTTVCGLVNAKNSFGGYVGPRRFYVWVNDGQNYGTIDQSPDDEPDKDDAFQKRWVDTGCG